MIIPAAEITHVNLEIIGNFRGKGSFCKLIARCAETNGVELTIYKFVALYSKFYPLRERTSELNVT